MGLVPLTYLSRGTSPIHFWGSWSFRGPGPKPNPLRTGVICLNWEVPWRPTYQWGEVCRHFPKGESSGICSEGRVISIRRSPGSNSSFIGDRSAPSVPTQCKISATTCGSSLHFPWPGYMAATLISCPGSFLRPAQSTPSQRGSVLNQEAPGLPGMI